MCCSFSRRVFVVALGIALTACGSDLTLPDDGSPPPDDRSPAVLLVVGGDGQKERVGRKLNEPLVVLLTDASARPVAGVPVAFAFREAVPDAEVDPIATTDERGEASAEVRLGSTVGSHTVEARVAEPRDLLATFGVTALAKGGHGGGGGGGGDPDDDDDDDDDEDDDGDDD
jgi:hypothetical protein